MSKKQPSIAALKKRIQELVVEVMHKSAELSEAREELKELKNTVDIYLDQEGHNKCWVREVWLRKRVKKPDGSTYPNQEKVSLVEFLWGCIVYAPEQHPALTTEEKHMMKEIETVLKKYLSNSWIIPDRAGGVFFSKKTKK